MKEPDLLTVLAGYNFRWGTLHETYGEHHGAQVQLLVMSDSSEALGDVWKRLAEHPLITLVPQTMVIGESNTYELFIDCSAIEPCPLRQRANYLTELLTKVLGKAPGT